MRSLTLEAAEEIAGRLRTSPGVHRPSPFSVLLASSLPALDGLRAIDAGCGAGLVTIAMLEAGAAQVVAQDLDPAAVADTTANVEALLGPGAGGRLETDTSDWRQLGRLGGDLLAVNPPQRPTEMLPAVPADERHLHSGGGDDGLDELRLVLRHMAADVVLSTASTSIPGDPAATGAALGWSATVLVERVLRHAEPWWVIADALSAPVRVWRFERR